MRQGDRPVSVSVTRDGGGRFRRRASLPRCRLHGAGALPGATLPSRGAPRPAASGSPPPIVLPPWRQPIALPPSYESEGRERAEGRRSRESVPTRPAVGGSSRARPRGLESRRSGRVPSTYSRRGAKRRLASATAPAPPARPRPAVGSRPRRTTAPTSAREALSKRQRPAPGWIVELHRARIELLRIKPTAEPAKHALVLLMAGIVDQGQEIFIASDAATVFRRARSVAVEAPRILLALLPRRDRLQRDLVLPAVSEVVLVSADNTKGGGSSRRSGLPGRAVWARRPRTGHHPGSRSAPLLQ